MHKLYTLFFFIFNIRWYFFRLAFQQVDFPPASNTISLLPES